MWSHPAMPDQSPDILAFDRFEIDVARGEFREDGKVRAIEPQVFDVLRFLAQNPGRILTRDDFIEAIWGGRIVSDSAISTRIKDARAALGDDGRSQTYIRTIPKRGFRFDLDTKPVSPLADTPLPTPSDL